MRLRQSSGSNSEVYPHPNKRLAQRWLDDMFLILYEDLKVYMTVFKTSSGKNKLVNPYDFNIKEWKLLGDLCYRLQNYVNFISYFLFLISYFL